MACYHPMHAFQIGYTDKGKPLYEIVSGAVEFIRPPRHAQHPFCAFPKLTNYVEIPCGKCIGCRLEYSRQWANRCVLEAKQFEHNAFLTLTYSDENLPLNSRVDKETGEILKVPTLKPSDLTKFLKDLRRYYEYHYNWKGIRFYACGEYGSNTQRPHYHIIAFNLPVFDKEYFFTNDLGDKVYLSKTISDIWKKGIISVGDVTWDSCAYTARYVMKKLKGKEAVEIYSDLGLEPEFVRMSRRPGLSFQFYKENKDKIYEFDEIHVSKRNGVLTIKPVKYYDRLFDIDDPEKLAKIKEVRKDFAINSMKLQLEKTSLDKLDYLKVKEEQKIYQIQNLKRKLKEF